MRYTINGQTVQMLAFAKALRALLADKDAPAYRAIWIGLHRPGIAADYRRTYLPKGMQIEPVLPTLH